MSRTPRVAVVCTDRGQHAWTALGDLMIDERSGNPSWLAQGMTGRLWANKTMVYGSIADAQKDDCVWVDEDHGYRVCVRCPRCRRNPQWARETALVIVARLAAAKVAQLDISLFDGLGSTTT